MKKKTTTNNPILSRYNLEDCKEFAKYQSLLLVLMLVFVGIVCLPPMKARMDHKKKNASVEKVWYRDDKISIVDLQVGRTAHDKVIVQKPLNENDILVVYVSKKNQLSLTKPDTAGVRRMMIVYFIILIMAIGVSVMFFFKKQN
jgi:hypothetical protein